MDFSYYNNKNEKIDVKIDVGTKWKGLKIQNQQLNSIFSQVDDGDGKVSSEELSLLEQIFKKADNVIKSTANNNILENEELDEVLKQIENGDIILPKTNARQKERSYVEKSTYQLKEGSTEQTYDDVKEDSVKIQERNIETIKKELRERFPKNKYEIDVKFNGKYYESFVYDKVTKILSKSVNIIRKDGIKLSLEDSWGGAISDDDNVYSENYLGLATGEFTITDKNGKPHKLTFTFDDLWNKDILDRRRAVKEAGRFFADLPQSTINELIEKGVEDISFVSDFDGLFYYSKEKQEELKSKMLADGTIIDIENYGFATIISPKFAPPKREYDKETNIQRSDGYKISIVDTSNNAADLKITGQDGKEVVISVKGDTWDGETGDKFHQWQIPKLVSMMKELPSSVLDDLQKEISSLKFMNSSSQGNGMYALGSDAIALTADSDYRSHTPTMTFVHELGHAIDNQNGKMLSETSEFKSKFGEFKTLLNKILPERCDNHACENSAEFFASAYAKKQMPGDNGYYNHIYNLECELEQFKDSDNPEEAMLYRLLYELENDANVLVEQTRKNPDSVRMNNALVNIVKDECKDVIEKLDKGSFLHEMYGQSTQLEILHALSLDDDGFNSYIKTWSVYAEDRCVSIITGEHEPTPPKIQKLYAELIEKVSELRERIKTNQQ